MRNDIKLEVIQRASAAEALSLFEDNKAYWFLK
jgi:HEAT repeat protein